jgi:glycerophosphoryl diester phosphodiesterase
MVMFMSIYIHIPFCNSICSYCDFCKVYYNKKYIYDYLDNLKKEISSRYKGEKVPGLREVLELAQGKIKLNIELKPADNGEELARKTVALIEKYNMENDCVITSFSSSALLSAKSCDENIRVGYILSAAYGDYYDMKNIDFFSVNAAYLSKRTIDAIHNSGKQVYAWTVNNKDSIKNLTNKGVDGVITDNPVLARETIYSRDTSETIVNMIRYVFNQ